MNYIHVADPMGLRGALEDMQWSIDPAEPIAFAVDFQIFYKSCLICPLSNFIRYHVCDLQLESPVNSALCRCRVSLDGMLGQTVDMGLRSKPLKV